MRRRWALAVFALMLWGCGGGSPAAPSRQTVTFTGSLDDPTACTCGNGINQFTITVTAAGRVDATATFQPADAQLVARLLDSSFNTVFATSTRSGNTASLSHEATPATYRLQVFLASSGPRQATFTLSVIHP